MVHRDVKPGNLLLAEEMGTTKLADFGIAKAAEQTRITQVGSVLGTAAYLSPEQARGEEAGPASDIYSLGVCAYQFLTGRLPHEYGSLTELALKQQQEPVRADHATTGPRCRPSSTRPCGSALERDPARATRARSRWPRRSRPGVRGEATDATQRLADELERPATPTTAARPSTAARRGRGPRAERRRPPRPRARRERPRRRDAPAARSGRGRWGTFLALLAAIAAIAVVAIALLSSSGGNSVEPVDTGDLQQQIDGLRDFIENTR